eukprot:comp21116_c0_seq1/m.28539 comp21116_c0_seq1/g.28539  ORF comp21116_c0_seq1/g.28539 comp21116_c0_seq1/m.28539 type:complete len:364 (-) comp21116_c0_seq1:803-1894(-)
MRPLQQDSPQRASLGSIQKNANLPGEALAAHRWLSMENLFEINQIRPRNDAAVLNISKRATLVNSTQYSYENGATPNELLRSAVESGDVDGVLRALQLGADVNCRDESNEPLLHQVIRTQNHNMWEIFRSQRVDVNAVDMFEIAALHIACTLRDLTFARGLVDSGASVNTRDKFGKSALHFAAAHNFVDAIVLLVMHGADINAQAKDGYTPLHVAMHFGHMAACVVLFKHGAATNIADINGRTPADEAPTLSFVQEVHWRATTIVEEEEEEIAEALSEVDRQTTASANEMATLIGELEQKLSATTKRCEELGDRCALLSSQLCDLVVRHESDLDRTNNLSLGAIIAAVIIPVFMVVVLRAGGR